jgi:hypothetical protein
LTIISRYFVAAYWGSRIDGFALSVLRSSSSPLTVALCGCVVAALSRYLTASPASPSAIAMVAAFSSRSASLR